MNRLKVNDPNHSLALTLQAYKSMVSGLDLRARQAEQMVSTLMSEKIPKEQLATEVFQRIVEHMAAREHERSTQYLAVIQSTLLALNQMAQSAADGALKAELVEIVKSLTITTKA